jgi:hypothetical protein
MQVDQRRSRRGGLARLLAIGLAASIVLVQLLALHHEAAVAHTEVARTGAFVHGQALGEHHELSSTSHLHSTNTARHEDSGACTLLSALDHATVVPAALAPLQAIAPAVHLRVAQPNAPPVVTRQLLLVAPKTSPPVAA